MKVISTAIVIILVTSGCLSHEEQLVKRADRIHAAILTVDTHCDTPMDIYSSGLDLGVRHTE